MFTAPLTPPATDRRPLVVVTRVLAGLFGVLKLVATTFFLFFSSATAPQSIGDWCVGIWSIVIGLAYLGVAGLLGRDPRVLPAMAGLAVADVAFSVVKFSVYDETAPIPFTAATLVLLALVVASSRPRRTA